ncbi:MAG: hypothetical protein HS128_13875 [Ideonella sp.]|nr:hypothetical protein [Ideonella sp.]MCC7458147.1 hypothetical protein [Nitrospira sp.]
MRTVLIVIGLVAAAAVVATGIGRWRHAAALARLQQRVLQAPAGARLAAAPEWAALPPPVARYLQWALGSRPDAPAGIEIEQAGELRTDENVGRWLRFHALQVVSPAGCGFVWNAKVVLAPLLHVRVVDSLVGGRAAGRVLLQSALAVADAGDEPELNAGALHRLLAEAVWFPWLLLPGEHLQWQAIDAQRARATLTCGGLSVALEFRFGADGEVVAIHTPARWGRFGGRYEQVPWQGHFARYEERAGVRVPLEGEVGWWRAGQLQLVWRGQVLGYRLIELQRAQPPSG